MPKGELKLRDLPEPADREGAVVVRVQAAPIVSYLREYVAGELAGYLPPAEPFVLGTSAVGTIEHVGTGVYGLRAGQRVLATGHLQVAENVEEPVQALLSMTASPAARPLLDDRRSGTMAELAEVPVSTVTPVPRRSTGSPPGHLLRCLVPYGGLMRGRLAPGETVIVNGATGSFGGAAVHVARAMGAGLVVAAGRNAERLRQLATKSRVHAVVLRGDVEVDADALRAAAGGGAHLAVDLVGGAADTRSAQAVFAALGRGGRLVLMGSARAPLPVAPTDLMLTGREVLGQFMYTREAPGQLLRLAAADVLDLHDDVAEVRPFGLRDLPAAMDAASSARGAAVVLEPEA